MKKLATAVAAIAALSALLTLGPACSSGGSGGSSGGGTGGSTGGGTGTGGGSATGGGSSTGGGSAASCPVTDGVSCNNLLPGGAMVTPTTSSASAPTPTGGTLVAGTYNMVSSTSYIY